MALRSASGSVSAMEQAIAPGAGAVGAARRAAPVVIVVAVGHGGLIAESGRVSEAGFESVRMDNASSTGLDPMGLALDEARRAAAIGEVPVGAVVVKDGRVIAAAGNRPREERIRPPMPNSSPSAAPAKPSATSASRAATST